MIGDEVEGNGVIVIICRLAKNVAWSSSSSSSLIRILLILLLLLISHPHPPPHLYLSSSSSSSSSSCSSSSSSSLSLILILLILISHPHPPPPHPPPPLVSIISSARLGHLGTSFQPLRIMPPAKPWTHDFLLHASADQRTEEEGEAKQKRNFKLDSSLPRANLAPLGEVQAHYQ